MFEPVPTLREPILEIVYMHPIDLVSADASPILDQSGNPIRDHNGNIIYA